MVELIPSKNLNPENKYYYQLDPRDMGHRDKYRDIANSEMLDKEDQRPVVGAKGCTAQSLSKRMAQHRISCKNKKDCNRKIYKHMNDLGIDKFSIAIVEEIKYKKSEKYGLIAAEGYWIDKMDTLRNGLNGQGAIVNKKVNTKDEYDELWKNNRKDQMKEYQKTDKCKQQKKEYQKEYRQKNRLKLRCACCNISFINNPNKKKHFKTVKHHKKALAYWKSRFNDVINSI